MANSAHCNTTNEDEDLATLIDEFQMHDIDFINNCRALLQENANFDDRVAAVRTRLLSALLEGDVELSGLQQTEEDRHDSEEAWRFDADLAVLACEFPGEDTANLTKLLHDNSNASEDRVTEVRKYLCMVEPLESSASPSSSAYHDASETVELNDDVMAHLMGLFPDISIEDIEKLDEEEVAVEPADRICSIADTLARNQEFAELNETDLAVFIDAIAQQFVDEDEQPNQNMRINCLGRLLESTDQLQELLRICQELAALADDAECSTESESVEQQPITTESTLTSHIATDDQLDLTTGLMDSEESVVENDNFQFEMSKLLADSGKTGTRMSHCTVEELAETSSDYKTISNLIVKISNPVLEKQFTAWRIPVDVQCAGEVDGVTQMLFHVTKPHNIENIVTEGFNRSFCGQHGVNYGQGSYFAKRFSYSFQYLDIPNSSKRYIFACEVLTGLSCVGNPALKVLPKVRNKHYRYHSAVNRVNNPDLYVIFHDALSIPRYLIEVDF